MSVELPKTLIGLCRAHRVPSVCERLQIGRTKLYELIAQGKLPAVKIGSSTRVLEADLVAFEANLPRFEPRREVPGRRPRRRNISGGEKPDVENA